jgi:DNA-binding response OmpR family regulator
MAGRVVIVESQAADRVVLQAILNVAHFDAVACRDLAAARQAVADRPPDILILDLGHQRDGRPDRARRDRPVAAG